MHTRVISLAFGLLFAVIAGAQSDAVRIQISPKGQSFSTVLNKDQKHIKKVIFWYSSPGNVSEKTDFNLEGPAQTSVSIRAVSQSTLSAEAVLAGSGAWYNANFVTANGRARPAITLVPEDILLGAHSLPATAGILNCTGLEKSDVLDLLVIYSAQLNKNLSVSDLCGDTANFQNGGPGTTPTPGGNEGFYGPFDPNNVTKSIGAIVSKDTCQQKKKAKYLVALEFDLLNVDENLYETGLTLAVSAVRRAYKGSMAASIKPVSDGKYAPRPLVLMATLGYGARKERIRVARWSRGKTRSAKELSIVKQAPHFGKIYSAAIASNVLTGGKATFELTDLNQIYSVCFELKRARQRVNGYP